MRKSASRDAEPWHCARVPRAWWDRLSSGAGFCHPPPPAAPRPPPDAATLLPPPDAATHGPTGTLELPDALVLVPISPLLRPTPVSPGRLWACDHRYRSAARRGFTWFPRRRYLPLPASPPTRIGAVRLFPDVPPRRGTSARLLDRSAEETLVWNVRAVRLGNRLAGDVPRTVIAAVSAAL